MSATIALFPQPAGPPMRGADAAHRYLRRAEEAFDLLAIATTDVERSTLRDIVEIWLEMAEAALPAPS